MATGCAHSPQPEDSGVPCLSFRREGRHTRYFLGDATASSADVDRAMARVPRAAAAEARRGRLSAAAAATGMAAHGLTFLVGAPLLLSSHSTAQTDAGAALMTAFPLGFVAISVLLEESGRARREAIDRFNAASDDSGRCPP